MGAGVRQEALPGVSAQPLALSLPRPPVQGCQQPCCHHCHFSSLLSSFLAGTSLGLMSLLGWHSEFREIQFLVFHFIEVLIKDRSNSQGKSCMGWRTWEGAQWAHTSSTPATLRVPLCVQQATDSPDCHFGFSWRASLRVPYKNQLPKSEGAENEERGRQI